MTTVTLEKLGYDHGTDKSARGHHYLEFYERFLLSLRFTATAILEIGVWHGQSLRMWADYFPNATVVGVDINAETQQHATDRITVEIADQSKVDDLERIAHRYGPFDLIQFRFIYSISLWRFNPLCRQLSTCIMRCCCRYRRRRSGFDSRPLYLDRGSQR